MSSSSVRKTSIYHDYMVEIRNIFFVNFRTLFTIYRLVKNIKGTELLSRTLQHDGINLLHFKHKQLYLTEFLVRTIKGLRHRVAKIIGIKNHR